MKRHVGAQRRLAHAGPSRQDQQVRGLQATQQIVDIGEARVDAGNTTAAGNGALGEFPPCAAAISWKIDRAFAIFGGLGHGIKRLFRLGDLLPRGLFGGGVIGGVDDILADADQAAPDRKVAEDVGIILDVGNGGRGGAQGVEIGLAAGLDHAGIGLHGGVQGQRRHHHPAPLDHL